MSLPRQICAVAAAFALTACTATPPVAPPPPAPAAPAFSVPPGMQFLYGSAESAALSKQAYNVLVDAVRRRIASEKADPNSGADRTSAVLAPGATIDQPTTLPCGDKPRAVVFDADETLLLNLGVEYDAAIHPDRYDTKAKFDARWSDWERTGFDKLVAVPGAVAAVVALRGLGVTVIVNTNRSAANAAFTETALDHAGLGQFKHGETLFLEGDLGSGSGKDSRRAAIAAKYCVIAMGGDQLGDFTDLFNAGLGPTVRRDAAQSPAIAGMWGRFWFVLPNPVYGTAIKGGFEEVFPSDRRWPSDTPSDPKEPK